MIGFRLKPPAENDYLYELVPLAYDEVFAQQCRIPGVMWSKRTGSYWLEDDQAAALVPALVENRLGKLTKDSVEPPAAPEVELIKRPLPGMRDYQVWGASAIRGMLLRSGAALLGDVPGLGKTVQSLCTLRSLKVTQALILCPAVVQGHWLTEVMTWLKYPAQILKLTKGQKVLDWDGIGIMSHDSFRSALKRLDQIACADMLVIDEAHFFANSRAQRSKALATYLKQCGEPRPYVLALTGTPVTTRISGMWNVLNLLWPGRFSSYYRFTQRYCEGHYEDIPQLEDKKVWVAEGASNLDELQARLKFCMVRREEQDVPNQLPDKTRTVIKVPLPDKARRSLTRTAIQNEKDLYWALGSIEEHKIKATIEHVNNLREQGSNVLVFTNLRKHARTLAKAFGTRAVTGAINPPSKRKLILDNHPGVGVATMASVTTGINLVKFDTVVYMGLSYDPTVMQQTESRVARIGQLSRHVNIFYMIGEKTIDELIQRKVISRLKNISGTLASKGAEGMSEDLSGDPEELISSIVKAAMKLAAASK